MLKWATKVTTSMNSDAVFMPVSRDIYIPPRFQKKLISHVLKVCLDLPPQYQPPLILTIQGPAGCGKSYQTRYVLEQLGFKFSLLDSSVLSGELEGDSIKPLRKEYLKLGSTNKISALIIDDFDMSIASHKNNYERTSNSDILNTFLMHLCDNPSRVEGDIVNPVPIIFTGNNFSSMYRPLLRYGRTELYEWEPTREEKEKIVQNILMHCGVSTIEINQLFNTYSTQSISFFRQIKTSLIDKATESIFELTRLANSNRKEFKEMGRVKVVEAVEQSTFQEVLKIASVISEVITRDYT